MTKGEGRSAPVEQLAARYEMICSDCEGGGRIADDAWVEWHHVRAQLVRDLRQAGGRIEAELHQEALLRHEAARPTTSRSTHCDECGGAGTVPTAEGEELLAFLRRHFTSRSA